MTSSDLYKELFERLRQEQSKKRFEHSVRVGDLAAKLGKRHGWNQDRARLAGLLHDYAKERSPKTLLAYVKKHRLKIPCLDFILETSPNMMHAYVSADVVRRNGWIKNITDIHAIASHTLADLNMTKEAKILFIADFAEPGRPYKSAKGIRKLAKEDLEAGFREAMTNKVGWYLKKSRAIHPFTISVWNRLICKVKAP